MTRARQATGRAGEQAAAEWYEEQGYTILDRNWRTRAGELDLVAERNRVVVFCEVKTRATAAYGTAAEAVTRSKRQRIRHLAAQWLEQSDRRARQIRFDVVAITDGRLEVIEGAF